MLACLSVSNQLLQMTSKRHTVHTEYAPLTLNIALVSGRSIEVEAPRQWTLRELHKALERESGIPVREQQLLVGNVCLTGALLAEQPLSTILGETEQLTLVRKDRSGSLGAAVFCEFGDQPQMAIDGNEIVLNWYERDSCFYGEEDVRPDDRTTESHVFIALTIPSLRLHHDVYIDGCNNVGFVPLPVGNVQLHVGPTHFSDVICQGKQVRPFPFKNLSLEVWLWCRTWEEKLRQEEIVTIRVKPIKGIKCIRLSMPGFSPMLVAEMLLHEEEAIPFSEFFLFDANAGSAVVSTKTASELQEMENEPVLHCLLAGEGLGRKGDTATLEMNLCSRLEQASPLHRNALEHLKCILFEGAQQQRIMSQNGVGNLSVGRLVTFAEFYYAVRSGRGSKGGSWKPDLENAWQRWKLLKLAA